MADQVQSGLHVLHGPAQQAGDFFELAGLHQLEVIGDDLLREGVIRIDQLDLYQQAFLQITRGNSGRIEFLGWRPRRRKWRRRSRLNPQPGRA